MPMKALSRFGVTYNGTDITAYLNQASLEIIKNAIDTTNLASTSKEVMPEASSFSTPIGGFWAPALDAILGADMLTGALRSLALQLGTVEQGLGYASEASGALGAFVSDYKIDASSPLGLITWSATLGISGRMERVVTGLEALMQNLVGYWPLNEAGGANNALDAHTNGLTLTQAGSPGSATGKVYAGARTITANEQRFSRATEALLETGDIDFGAAIWVYPTTTGSHTLIAKANTGTSDEFALSIASGLATLWMQVTTTTAHFDLSIAVSVPVNAWTLLILQHNASAKKFTVYKNGNVGVDSAAYTGTLQVSADAFTLGAWSDGAYSMRGRLGPVSFWKNWMIDAPARAALWNAGAGLTYDGTPSVVTTLVATGDSITEGYSSTTEATRWANIVAADKGWSLVNTGISGTILQNTVQNTIATIGGAATNNLRDNYQSRILDHAPQKVVIMMGTNDARLNDAAITAANYQTDLGQIVDFILATGVAAQSIVLCSPPWMEAAYYSSFAPFNGATAQKYLDYTAAVAAVAAAKGTRYADVYNAMAAIGASLMSGDHIHPNDAGHAVIASTVLAALA